MNFKFPSLERTALLKVASVLWSKGDFRYYWYDRRNTFERTAELEIAPSLRKKLNSIIEIVNNEMLRWGRSYSSLLSSVPVTVSVDLSWDRMGKISGRSIAKSLIRCEKIDIFGRYLLSCVFCLEEDISNLMKNLNGEDSWGKTKVPKCDIAFRYWSVKTDPDLIYFSHNVRSILERYIWSDFSDMAAFPSAVQSGNPFLSEYLWMKLPTNYKINFLDSYLKMFMVVDGDSHIRIPDRHNADVFCALLWHMDEEIQNSLLRDNAFSFLHHFLYWPYNEFFLHFAKSSYGYLSHKELLHLLDSLVTVNSFGFCTDIFGEVWKQIPESRRELVRQDAMDFRFYPKITEQK